jgi:hypothetical protein
MSEIGGRRSGGDVIATQRMRFLPALFAALLTVAASGAFGQTYQYDEYPVTPIHFPPGKTAVIINDSVERGASATYTFVAKEGQHADIRLTTEEDNASFIFYMPGATVSRDEGGYDVSGPTLPNAGRHGGATHWTGRLPVGGKYTLTIQPSRGGATYHLSITIK